MKVQPSPMMTCHPLVPIIIIYLIMVIMIKNISMNVITYHLMSLPKIWVCWTVAIPVIVATNATKYSALNLHLIRLMIPV